MIVDVHYHQIPFIPEELISEVLKDPIRSAKLIGMNVDMADLTAKATEYWSDPDGDKLIAAMDAAGIDFTVVCAVDNSDSGHITEEMMLMQNQMVAAVAQKYPKRVMALAGVDPRRPNAPDLLKKCFEAFGMKGLKYHADYGYDPAGRESYRLLEILAAENGILLSHTGPLGPPSRAHFAEPMRLADIGVDFPEVRVIAAHMGLINWRSWASLATHQPNLYGDLAMWDTYAIAKYDLFCRELRDIIDFVGVEKILFATDDPIMRVIRPAGDWIALIRDLPEKAPHGISFSHAEVSAILGGNAKNLLDLD
ncbi:MAG: amidohydrolase family protein [Desulfobacterales bacterium]